VRCAFYEEERGWTEAAVSTNSRASGYPTLASTGDGFWLLAYHANARTLSVSLHCSRDGRSFEAVKTLSETPLPPEEFCARAGLPCRKDLERFTPGDYVGLAASERRLAAAYVLPGDRAVVSVVDLSSKACSVAFVRSLPN
jgi:hypothetical protein